MVKRLLQVVGVVVGLIVLAGILFAVYVTRTWDRIYDAPLPQVQISTDPAVLARGEYLVYGPAHCIECHGSSFDSLERLATGEHVPLSGGLPIPMGPLGVGCIRQI